MNEPIAIASRDYWVKVVEMLEQNWALLEPSGAAGGVACHLIDDASRVFDRIDFDTRDDAEAALRRNGFERYADEPTLRSFLRPPEPPFHARGDDRRIYSSGRYWRDPDGD